MRARQAEHRLVGNFQARIADLKRVLAGAIETVGRKPSIPVVADEGGGITLSGFNALVVCDDKVSRHAVKV